MRRNENYIVYKTFFVKLVRISLNLKYNLNIYPEQKSVFCTSVWFLEDHELAEIKLKNAEHTSNLDTEDEMSGLARKRKLGFTSSCSSGNENTLLQCPRPPTLKIKKKVIVTYHKLNKRKDVILH